LGARGVNNLSSKLLLTMLPPNAPFFQLQIGDAFLDALAEEQGAEAKTKVESALAKMERTIMDDIDSSDARVGSFEALKHLLVGGNILVHSPKKGGLRVFQMWQYCVKRDPEGTVLEIIIEEKISPASIPAETLDACKIHSYVHDQQKKDEPIPVYTHIKKDGDHFQAMQELNGWPVPGSFGQFPVEKSPFIALRWAKLDGEDYGRGLVEEYLGDLISLEGLMKSIVQGSAAAAKVLFLVAPNSTTKHKDIVTAESGDVKTGRAEDVSVLQMDKYGDFKIALDTIGMLDRRLSFAFMLNSSVQRKGERVTATEIQMVAGELEDALGGAYSLLSQEFQLPLLKSIKNRMTKAGLLPALPEKDMQIKIITGMQALGRKHEQDKLDLLLQHLTPFGPEVLAEYLKMGEYIQKTATNLGVDIEGLIRSEEEVQEARQAQQQAMQQQQMLEGVMKAGGPIVKEMVKQQGEKGNG
jgi:hypothetical protein